MTITLDKEDAVWILTCNVKGCGAEIFESARHDDSEAMARCRFAAIHGCEKRQTPDGLSDLCATCAAKEHRAIAARRNARNYIEWRRRNGLPVTESERRIADRRADLKAQKDRRT